MSNNTFWAAPYEPDAPKPIHHWEMELSTICIVNSLTLITLVGRTCYRWMRLKRFRKEDGWILGAVFVFIGLFACQLGASMTGSGLRIENVPDSWLKPHWIFSWGWIGYYLSISMIKVAICCSLLEFLPYHFKTMRRLIVALCFFIMALAIAESLMWLFQCKPIASNFVFSVPASSCMDIDYPRYIWSALSIPIDIAILSVPFEVVKRTGLQPHEKLVLKWVFGANLLGTIACGIGIYGTWENRESVQADVYYSETIFIMINDIEIFCYALGATFPILSRFFIAKSTPSQLSPSRVPQPSWLRPLHTLSSSFLIITQMQTQIIPKPQTPNFTGYNTPPPMLPRKSSRRNKNPQPSLLPIAEIRCTDNCNARAKTPISDFITVLQSLNEEAKVEGGERMSREEMGESSERLAIEEEGDDGEEKEESDRESDVDGIETLSVGRYASTMTPSVYSEKDDISMC